MSWNRFIHNNLSYDWFHFSLQMDTSTDLNMTFFRFLSTITNYSLSRVLMKELENDFAYFQLGYQKNWLRVCWFLLKNDNYWKISVGKKEYIIKIVVHINFRTKTELCKFWMVYIFCRWSKKKIIVCSLSSFLFLLSTKTYTNLCMYIQCILYMYFILFYFILTRSLLAPLSRIAVELLLHFLLCFRIQCCLNTFFLHDVFPFIFFCPIPSFHSFTIHTFINFFPNFSTDLIPVFAFAADAAVIVVVSFFFVLYSHSSE